jgi:thiol-disulfide isomerase/thioredoxin
MTKKIILLTFFIAAVFTTQAQQVSLIKFPTLEKYLTSKSDTLYVINFWATWCKPCVEELPYFEKINAEYKDQKVKVLLISLDFTSQHEKQVVPFVQRRKLASEVMHLNEPNQNAWIDKVHPEWSGAIPATLFVHSSSSTYLFEEKPFTYEELKSKIVELTKP